MTKNRAAYRARTRPAPRAPNTRTGGFVDVENKFLDSELTATSIPSTWTSLNPTGTGCNESISVPSQGDGESQRDGRVYYINAIHVKGKITTDAAESQVGPLGPSYVRVILYWDTQTNASQAVATDIMDAGLTDDFLAFRNLQNSKRFVVLKDKVIRVNPQAMNEGSANLFAVANSTAQFSFNKKFKKPIKVRCVGTSADVASASDNNFGIAAINSNEGGVTRSITYQARVRFSG